MTNTPRAYVICGTPRSGSTLLCEMLWATKAAGRPNSYYREQDVLHWAEQWGLSHPDGLETAAFDRAYLAAMREAGSAGTGLFGLRIMKASLADASRRLARATDSDADLAELFERAFGRTLYIHVTRGDKVAQAVSRLRAEQSGIWHLRADGSVLEGNAVAGPISYDRGRIAQFVSELHEDDKGWNAFFANRGIEPLRLSYETTMADPQAALGNVLSALHLGPDLARTVPVITAKMGDETSKDWVERFREETSA